MTSQTFASKRHWKLSRFARNREDSIIYKRLLRKHGVDVISINEPIDDSPAGQMLEGMIEVMDEFYSTNLSKNTMRGMKENASRGYHNGGNVPVGYKTKKTSNERSAKSILILDTTFSPIARRIFTMYIDGLGAKEIAKILNNEGILTNKGKRWGKGSIYYILQNEIYTGTLVWNKSPKHLISRGSTAPTHDTIRVEDNHPAIIGQDDFATVQRLLNERAPEIVHPRTVNSPYLLSGLLYCGKCQSRMTCTAAKSSKFFYYTCNKYSKEGKSACSAGPVPKDKLEAFVIERIRENILTEDNLAELVKLTNEEINKSRDQYDEQISIVDGQLNEQRLRLGRLYDSLETGKLDIDDIAPRIKEIKSNVDALDLQKEELERKTEAQVSLLPAHAVRSYVDDLRGLLSVSEITEQKAFLRSFVKRIEVDWPKITIEYTIPINRNGGDNSGGGKPFSQEVLSMEKNGSPKTTILGNGRKSYVCIEFLPLARQT